MPEATDTEAAYQVARIKEDAAAYLVGGEPEKATLRREIEAVLAEHRPNAAVYVAKLTPGGVLNQIWQGRGLSEPHDVFVLLDQGASAQSIAEEVPTRLSPPGDYNGYDSVLVARKSDGSWEPYAVVEVEQSDIGGRLRATFPDLRIVKVPDPGVRNSLAGRGRVGAVEDELDPEEVLLHLNEAKNVVLEGPPGTGKTRLALQVAGVLAEGQPKECRLGSLLDGQLLQDRETELRAAPLVWDLVQLHPSYSYEEFVRGQRTDPEAAGFALRSVDGILPTMARVAQLRGSKPTLLVIDEINRCNLSSVLGETVFAIDPAYRGRSVSLQYDAADRSTAGLQVPPNLFILATMNTADRSIAMLDFAIRRRFRFLYLGPSSAAIAAYYAGREGRASCAQRLFTLFNEAIDDRDLRPGHSYFLIESQNDLEDPAWAKKFVAKVMREVRPLMREYLEEGVAGRPVIVGSGENAVDLVGGDEAAADLALRSFVDAELAAP